MLWVFTPRFPVSVFHKVNRSGKAKVLSAEERELLLKFLPESTD